MELTETLFNQIQAYLDGEGTRKDTDAFEERMTCPDISLHK